MNIFILIKKLLNGLNTLINNIIDYIFDRNQYYDVDQNSSLSEDYHDDVDCNNHVHDDSVLVEYYTKNNNQNISLDPIEKVTYGGRLDVP